MSATAGIALPEGMELRALPERTYTQTQVEQFFAEAVALTAELDGSQPRLYQHAMNYAYLKGRFVVGGAR